MKRLFILGITVILLLSITACGAKPADSDITPDPAGTEEPADPDQSTENPDPSETPDSEQDTQTPGQNENEEAPDIGSVLSGSLEGILEKIYETADCSNNFKEYMKTGLQTTEVTEERTAYYLGKDGIEYEEALASEPIMMPSAYELTLVRVKEGADIEKTKKEIKENVDPQKWVCVGVDPKNVIVDSIDDVIVIIMSDNECEALHDAFLALKG